MKNRISISKEQFEEIETLAKDYRETPKEMIEHLLEAQLQAVRHKQVFYPGLKWELPKATMVQAAIQKREYQKLRTWLDSGDKIGIFTQGDQGVIYLLNETGVDQIRIDKVNKLEEVIAT